LNPLREYNHIGFYFKPYWNIYVPKRVRFEALSERISPLTDRASRTLNTIEAAAHRSLLFISASMRSFNVQSLFCPLLSAFAPAALPTRTRRMPSTPRGRHATLEGNRRRRKFPGEANGIAETREGPNAMFVRTRNTSGAHFAGLLARR
jgi:hypothetical protein